MPPRLPLSAIRLAALFLATGLLSPFVARAADTPVITIAKSGGQTNLALNPLAGADGAAATKTVADDLTLAGAFCPPGRSRRDGHLHRPRIPPVAAVSRAR